MHRQTLPSGRLGRLLYTLFRRQTLVAEELLEINIPCIHVNIILCWDGSSLFGEFGHSCRLRCLNGRFICICGQFLRQEVAFAVARDLATLCSAAVSRRGS